MELVIALCYKSGVAFWLCGFQYHYLNMLKRQQKNGAANLQSPIILSRLTGASCSLQPLKHFDFFLFFLTLFLQFNLCFKSNWGHRSPFHTSSPVRTYTNSSVAIFFSDRFCFWPNQVCRHSLSLLLIQSSDSRCWTPLRTRVLVVISSIVKRELS
jgi:hypothetical protein